MPEPTPSHDPGALWRSQSPETLALNVERFAGRRMRHLLQTTRSDILGSVFAACLFAGVIAWRLSGVHRGIAWFSLLAVLVWVAISLFRFRRRLWPGCSPDVLTSTGLEHYRMVLESRRDHLKNGWLWMGPAILASLALGGLLVEQSLRYQRLRSILPFLVLLVIWLVFGFLARRSKAAELQRELDELNSMTGTAGHSTGSFT